MFILSLFEKHGSKKKKTKKRKTSSCLKQKDRNNTKRPYLRMYLDCHFLSLSTVFRKILFPSWKDQHMDPFYLLVISQLLANNIKVIHPNQLDYVSKWFWNTRFEQVYSSASQMQPFCRSSAVKGNSHDGSNWINLLFLLFILLVRLSKTK